MKKITTLYRFLLYTIYKSLHKKGNFGIKFKALLVLNFIELFLLFTIITLFEGVFGVKQSIIFNDAYMYPTVVLVSFFKLFYFSKNNSIEKIILDIDSMDETRRKKWQLCANTTIFIIILGFFITVFAIGNGCL
jgi:hypothetical protein